MGANRSFADAEHPSSLDTCEAFDVTESNARLLHRRERLDGPLDIACHDRIDRGGRGRLVIQQGERSEGRASAILGDRGTGHVTNDGVEPGAERAPIVVIGQGAHHPMKRFLDDILGILHPAPILPGDGHRRAQVALYEDIVGKGVAALCGPRQLLVGWIPRIAHGSCPGSIRRLLSGAGPIRQW